jgi:hypothetical protein
MRGVSYMLSTEGRRRYLLWGRDWVDVGYGGVYDVVEVDANGYACYQGLG